MLVALIADIHGNVPALEAVLGELEQDGVDQVLCLGDVGIGPQPVETLERVEELGCPVIMGNWDALFLGRHPSLDGELEHVLAALGAWSTEQLSPAHVEYVKSFRETVEVALGDGATLLAFHGSPRSYEDAILATTSDEELEQMLDGRKASVLACAHTHFQLFRRFGESILVNPGSVGLPFRRQQPGVMRVAPWAEYALVTHDPGRLAIELRRTAYDVERFLQIMRRSGMPHADWWADLWSAKGQAVA
ncbi:MAG: metallophosphoesterase family protein [Gaiellaceae bacterium]